MLELKDVSGGYGSEKIIKQASFSVKKGEIFGILGPNGSGKTTLLKMISGALPFEEGEILLEGKNIRDFKAKELAKAMAVLPQQTEASFSYKVKDIVMLGRYPHQKGIFQHESAHDNDVVKSAMKQTGVLKYENKTLQSLSGGERQRVMLARALAQEPKLLLLDEPTNHLDISYQMSLLNTLKNWSIKNDLTVIAILHDLNMASLYCDRLLLLHNGEMSALNKPAQVMNEQRLQHVYQADIDRTEHPTVPSPLITLVPTVEQKGQGSFLEELSIEQSDELIVIKSPFLLKTFSSAVIGAGFGWKETFVNRFVDKNYDSDNAEEEYKQFLETKQIEVEETIGMMTAAILEDASFMKQEEEDFSLFVVVTAGVSNAVDVAKAYLQEATPLTVGTINTWIFVDGELSEAAFVQGMMTATEAKVKAMMEEKVLDPVTETIATGTSTDSLMIAATQQGAKIEYAGTITPLGKAIGRTVFEATSMAIKKNKERRKRL